MQLSVIIPARNEQFLSRTIQDIFERSEAETEVIAILDGAWADPSIPQDPRVNVIYLPKSIGQRAATNIGVRLSRGKYIAKVDAHCSFEQGWDRKMIEFMEKHGDDVTAVPIMRNLWAFDWKCYHCGWKKYQGPTPEKCGQCGRGDKVRKKMMWVGKERPQSWSYCFDAEPHFQYFEDYKHRSEVREERSKNRYTETMSLQGSFYMMTRANYLNLAPMREEFGSWGNEGLEIACYTWLSGGRVLVNHDTWYAHMFRTQGGDFGFPYEQSGKHVSRTKSRVWDSIVKKRLPSQKHPVSWLVERFWPVKGWTEQQLNELKARETDTKMV